MNTDEAVRRLREVPRRKHLALATGRSYRDYLKGLPSHLPSDQKPERLLTPLAEQDCCRWPLKI